MRSPTTAVLLILALVAGSTPASTAAASRTDGSLECWGVLVRPPRCTP